MIQKVFQYCRLWVVAKLSLRNKILTLSSLKSNMMSKPAMVLDGIYKSSFRYCHTDVV